MLAVPFCLFSSTTDLDASLDEISFFSSFGRFASETAFARDLESENCSTLVTSLDPHIVHFALVPFLCPKECPHLHLTRYQSCPMQAELIQGSSPCRYKDNKHLLRAIRKYAEESNSGCDFMFNCNNIRSYHDTGRDYNP